MQTKIERVSRGIHALSTTPKSTGSHLLIHFGHSVSQWGVCEQRDDTGAYDLFFLMVFRGNDPVYERVPSLRVGV